MNLWRQNSKASFYSQSISEYSKRKNCFEKLLFAPEFGTKSRQATIITR